MTFLITYFSLLTLAIALFFVKTRYPIKYRRWLIYSHLLSLLLLCVDLYLIEKFEMSFKTIWIDRLIIIIFLLSGAMTFSLYRKTLTWWTSLYFGTLFFYPLLAAFTFLIDRIFFIIVAAPLIVTLSIPDIYYADQDFDIRSQGGIMAPMRYVLIKKDLLLERTIGTSNDAWIKNGSDAYLKLVVQQKDNTTILIDMNNSDTLMIFKPR